MDLFSFEGKELGLEDWCLVSLPPPPSLPPPLVSDAQADPVKKLWVLPLALLDLFSDVCLAKLAPHRYKKRSMISVFGSVAVSGLPKGRRT